MCLQSVAAIRRKTHQSICHVTKDQPVIIFQYIARRSGPAEDIVLLYSVSASSVLAV